jgi:hypothetical protein
MHCTCSSFLDDYVQIGLGTHACRFHWPRSEKHLPFVGLPKQSSDLAVSVPASQQQTASFFSSETVKLLPALFGRTKASLHLEQVTPPCLKIRLSNQPATYAHFSWSMLLSNRSRSPVDESKHLLPVDESRVSFCDFPAASPSLTGS